ncbi:ATP-binding cassette domain-containing protein [Microbacterium sp. NPDC091382]|uniref:ATP-binding cassette domain-containing protein n=1 Tax=Microbacterium sp. NPDC091382 TaxID=3364210 RepID=UPI00380D0CF8
MQLSVKAVSFGFRDQPLLFDDVSFTLRPGELTALVGPSGSGKSTLLSLLAGQISPVSGERRVEGITRIGWILQNPVGSPRRTAIDHVVFPLLLRGITRRSAEPMARELLDRFLLTDVADRPFRKLSGGEAQRLAFARATAAGFDALLIDEPTAQLDPRTAQTIREVIRGLISPERLVLVATHDPQLRDECDHVVDLGLR